MLVSRVLDHPRSIKQNAGAFGRNGDCGDNLRTDILAGFQAGLETILYSPVFRRSTISTVCHSAPADLPIGRRNRRYLNSNHASGRVSYFYPSLKFAHSIKPAQNYDSSINTPPHPTLFH